MFWEKLQKPFFVLAPLADVTDAAFRRVIAKYSAHMRSDGTVGGSDVMWTEFVSADGLILASEEGRRKLIADLLYSEAERPIVAQLFSAHPEHMEKAARLCFELGFDGIDINMGCPDRSIEKQGCGAAMIQNPEKAWAIIAAAKRGSKGQMNGKEKELPVSVKTRIGYNTDALEEWLPALLEATPAAVTLHARTRKDMSRVPAKWECVKRAVEIRNACKSETLIIGNGDVINLADAREKANDTGVDGVMLGRAIFGNPWLFHPERDSSTVSIEERLRVMVEHTKLFEELLPHKNLAIMKKHYKAYMQGFEGASALRSRLMETTTASEIESIVEAFIHDAPDVLLQSSATLSL
jgi:nifR3 family TIM-barrel protein